MQLAPQRTAALLQVGQQNPTPTLAARPPQVDTGHHQDDAPASRQLDQPVADRADHQLAVQRPGDRLQVVLGVLGAKQLAAVRIDEQVDLPPVLHTDKLRAAIGRGRRQVLADLQLRIGSTQMLQLLVGAHHRSARTDLQQVVVHQLVELRFEQVDDPGQRQQDHERSHEQPGVEMPAPGQVVELGNFLLHFYSLHAGLFGPALVFRRGPGMLRSCP
ncbi:hypothetical protein D3C78_839190 [compost metagenome]